MGATTTSKKQDTRKPNLHTSGLPERLALAIFLAGVKLGEVLIPQGDKLSEKGNVTYSGGIRKGWTLGTINPEFSDAERAAFIMDTLRSLGFAINGQTLNVAGTGVHPSEKGNPTVCHTGVVQLPVEGNGSEPVSYMVQVYPTFSNAKGNYNLSVRAFPLAINVGGPQVVGEIVGDGIVVL